MAPPKKQGPDGNQKTLHSFFTRPVKSKVAEPSPVEKVEKEKPSTTESQAMEVDQTSDEEVIAPPLGRRRKRVTYKESDSESEQPVVSKNPFAAGKKRRLVRRSSDSDNDEEFKPSKAEKDEEEFDDLFDDTGLDELMTEAEGKRVPVTPLTEKFKNISVETSASKYEKPTNSLLARMSGLSSKQEKRQDRNQKFKEKNDERYQWLQEQKDLQGNAVDSPDYDPRTLFIPANAWSKFTPFEKQYWEVKHKFWDTGKFYELYEKDADIGHKDFDLKMTDRVNMRMVGVPEMSFDYWTAQFIAKGHKVAKVDQMETALGKSMREKGDTKASKADKIIRRELTSVLTAGTLVDSGLLTNDLSTYCMSIKEYCGDETLPPTFGICFVDTATAEFNLVHFEDDVNRTKFETLIMQVKPRELVTEKGRLSKATTRLLKSLLNSPLWNMLIPEAEFWDDRVTKDELECNEYWTEAEENNKESLHHAMEEARKDPLLMSSFGGLIWYLRSLKLDRELLSTKNILIYNPIRNSTSLVLDGQTLINLEIFQNSHDGSTEGTVFKLLANSIAPFGKRLFKRWLCHPLRNPKDINDRLDAIEDLIRLTDIHADISKLLASMPDLERLISRIHSGRMQVKEFFMALKGFQSTCDVIRIMTENRSEYKSKLLSLLIDRFPRIDEKLNALRNSFITAEVDVDYQKEKSMIPISGDNEEWDLLNQQIKDVQQQFADHLKVVQKQLRNSKIAYKDINKDIYQIEVPKTVKVPDDWIKMSNTTAFNRYYDQTVKSLVLEFKELKETKNAFVKKFATQVYTKFDDSYPLWLSAVQNIAELDALMGLAKGSIQMGDQFMYSSTFMLEPACRPTFIEQERGVIEFEELRHPCVVPGVATDFIPNDVGLGGQDPSLIVLTGPNMGGKSTLLRQTCVAVIMAQLGGYVPAKSCKLTACDRIYTRIGANDNIMGGQSTFMVELAETSKILREASSKSLVILDELGRGTSTFDGYSIAYSVLHYLSTHIGCLGMFATHYQTLCKEFERNPEINNMHMGYIMDEHERNVTFLYKLTSGICEKSFGMNVADMAGIPKDIIDRATTVAEEADRSHKIMDSTHTMLVDGESQMNITPAIAADLKYLLFAKKKNQLAVDRVINSFKKMDI
ncbi:hypothetical protein HPULCUR_004963 [Helicostylum pulchrum]|uniref:DNA mismatch repair protein n=1 Tax=Helicostylum pulchrum TaxID=562976 RepID=A0ABP9XXR6_9FUNG